MPRFVVLEHTGHPEDPAGRHYDLLLEDPGLPAGPACHTWRLDALPVVGGPEVTTRELPPHRLEWLDRVEGPVSGDRGFARRIDAGTYEPVSGFDGAQAALVVVVRGDALVGRLRLERGVTGRARLDAAPVAPKRS